MARYLYQQIVRSSLGVPVAGASVAIKNAGTTTPSTIYADASIVTPITGATVTTADTGLFFFYLDSADYSVSSLFDVALTASGYPMDTFTDQPLYQQAVGGSGGVTAFTSLTDTPASYTGQAGKAVVVNGTETGLEFTTAGTGTVTSVSSTDAYIGVSEATPAPVLTLNVGTGANQIVALDGSAKLPAVDGSQLTGLVGGGHTIQDEGTPLTARANLNFTGAGVAVTDDSGNNATVVTINGGSGSSTTLPFLPWNDFRQSRIRNTPITAARYTQMKADLSRGLVTNSAYGTILSGAFAGQEYISPAGLYNDMWFPGETFVHVLENAYEALFVDDATRAIAALRTMCDWGLAKKLVGTSDYCVEGCVGEMLDHHDNVIYSGMTGYVPYGSTSITGALYVATPWLYGFGRGFDATWVAWVNANWDALVTTFNSASRTAYDSDTGLWGQSTNANHQAILFSDGGNDRHWFDAGGNIGYTIWMGFVHRLMAELAWRAGKSQATIDAYADVWFRACRAVSAQVVTIENPHLYEYVREEWRQFPTSVVTVASGVELTVFTDTNSSGAATPVWRGDGYGTVTPQAGGGVRLWTNRQYTIGGSFEGTVGIWCPSMRWMHADFHQKYTEIIIEVTPEKLGNQFHFRTWNTTPLGNSIRWAILTDGHLGTASSNTFVTPLVDNSPWTARNYHFVAGQKSKLRFVLNWTANTYDIYADNSTTPLATGIGFCGGATVLPDAGFAAEVFGMDSSNDYGVVVNSVVFANPIEAGRTPEPMMALPYQVGTARVGNTIAAGLAPKAALLGMLQPSQERAVCAYIRHMALQPDLSGRGAGELFGFPSGVGAGNTWRGYVRTTPKSREHVKGFSCVSRVYGGSLNRFNYGGNADGGYWRAQHGSFIWCIAQIDQTLATQVASRLEDDVQTENTATGNTYAPWEQRLIYDAGNSWQGPNRLQATLTALLAVTPTGKV